MAKKIAATGKAPESEKDIYPWLRLLELEVHPAPHSQPHKGRGRPPNPFPRKAIHVTLTDDELATLDKLSDTLSSGMGSRLHRGHVIAFLSFYLHSRLQKGSSVSLPEGVNSLGDLARYLDKLRD